MSDAKELKVFEALKGKIVAMVETEKAKEDPFQRAIVGDFAGAAHLYLRAGLDLYYSDYGRAHASSQAAIGMLAIAVELMLKAGIAEQHPALVLKGLSARERVALLCPDRSSPGYRSSWLARWVSQAKTIDLGECIGFFKEILPDDHQQFGSHFRALSAIRNSAVHGTTRSLEIYELDRLAHLALTLPKELEEKAGCDRLAFRRTKEDQKFLEGFEVERVERVQKAIDAAKLRAQSLRDSASILVEDGEWEVFAGPCPVCDSDGIMSGETQIGGEQAGPEDWDVILTFLPYSFECEECGLSLGDPEEMRLAGMELSHDRSEELALWREGEAGEIGWEDYHDHYT